MAFLLFVRTFFCSFRYLNFHSTEIPPLIWTNFEWKVIYLLYPLFSFFFISVYLRYANITFFQIFTFAFPTDVIELFVYLFSLSIFPKETNEWLSRQRIKRMYLAMWDIWLFRLLFVQIFVNIFWEHMFINIYIKVTHKQILD